MYTTIYEFAGDPTDLLPRYDAMTAEVGAGNLLLHLAGATDDGIVVVDTCPSLEIHEHFEANVLPVLLDKHGLPRPSRITSFPLHLGIAEGDAVRVPVG